MAALRRSSRQRAKPKGEVNKDEEEVDGSEEEGGRNDYGEDEDDSDDQSAGLSDTSEDEWVPPSKKQQQQKSTNGNGKKRALVDESDTESSEGVANDIDDEDEEVVQPSRKAPRGGKDNKKRKITIKSNTNKNDSQSDPRPKTPVPQVETVEAEAIETAENESDDETTRAEAKRLWEEFRSRKKNKDANKTSIQNKAPPGGLDQWLGIKPPAWPSTCPEAMINDRDSLFVGFVYALSAPSQAEITHCLSHLSKVVQPQHIPTDRLPPAMQHLAPNRRGATHDMYAWRCLALKRGRDGLGGPEDFGLEEGQEDDGERYGAKEIAKAINMYGATDVLVIVSRWYGGTMLGPARFRHIEECAKAALARHMVNEAMVESRTELMELDDKINQIRSQRDTISSQTISSQTSVTQQKNSYEDLIDPERAQRLIMARKKQIELLQKSAKKQNLSSQHSTPLQPHLQEQESSFDDMNAAEEEAALEVIREIEREELLTQQTTNSIAPNEDAVDNPTSTQHKEADIEVTIPIKTEEDRSNTINVKEEDGMNSVTIKKEPSENAILPSAASKPADQVVTVKEEVEDETDLAGWDAL